MIRRALVAIAIVVLAACGEPRERLRVIERGSGSGPVIVLLHGYGSRPEHLASLLEQKSLRIEFVVRRHGTVQRKVGAVNRAGIRNRIEEFLGKPIPSRSLQGASRSYRPGAEARHDVNIRLRIEDGKRPADLAAMPAMNFE